jgi:hypothetical protein
MVDNVNPYHIAKVLIRNADIPLPRREVEETATKLNFMKQEKRPPIGNTPSFEYTVLKSEDKDDIAYNPQGFPDRFTSTVDYTMVPTGVIPYYKVVYSYNIHAPENTPNTGGKKRKRGKTMKKKYRKRTYKRGAKPPFYSN